MPYPDKNREVAQPRLNGTGPRNKFGTGIKNKCLFQNKLFNLKELTNNKCYFNLSSPSGDRGFTHPTPLLSNSNYSWLSPHRLSFLPLLIRDKPGNK
jgi:hypothetical protein